MSLKMNIKLNLLHFWEFLYVSTPSKMLAILKDQQYFLYDGAGEMSKGRKEKRSKGDLWGTFASLKLL
jgi:hypothetical protein